MESGESGGRNWFESLLGILGSILTLVKEGKRKAEEVVRLLEIIVQRVDFYSFLTASRSASVNTDTPADGWAAEWSRFYQQVFGITVDLSSVRVADDPGGFGWVVFVAKELTYNRVYAMCRGLFASSSFYGDDLDSVINKEERTADKGPYAVRFRNRVESDEENINTSANTLAERQTQNITLLEAMLMELWYFWRTGGSHLNFVRWVLCAGSRYLDGNIPCVARDDDEFHVSSCCPSNASDSLSSRSAVHLTLHTPAL